MREPHRPNYASLREAEQKVDAGRRSGSGPEIAAQGTGHKERDRAGDQQGHKSPDRADAQQGHAPLTEMDAYEAKRAAFSADLDAQVRAGHIEGHERRYQMARFDNDSVMPGARTSSRSLGMEPEAAAGKNQPVFQAVPSACSIMPIW